MTAEHAVPLVSDPLPTPSTPYGQALDDLLRDFFRHYPEMATGIGFHLHDGAWTDDSETGRQARLAMLRQHRGRVRALDEASLAPDERVDRGLLVEAIDQAVFSEDVLRESAWDPMGAVYIMGAGLFTLLAREFAPWQHRGRAFLERVKGVPQVAAIAQANLVGLPDRPVSLLHTETALAQLGGVGELIDEGLAEAGRRAANGEDPDLPAALEAAATDAKAALAAFRAALDGEIRARAEGDGRLGAELFGHKLHFTLASDLSAVELAERARRDYELVRGEMVRVAREIWPRWVPGEAIPEPAPGADDPDGAIVRRVLDAIALEHPRPDELLEWSTAEVARIEEFCRERDVIGLTDEPMTITWTPLFMRAYGRAFCDSPGFLDKGLDSHFWITPPDESLGEEATESYLREDNDRMMRLLCIHEGVPGHYLQGAWSNRTGTLTRAVFSSGMFAEGWAVYVTQVMMDLGYGADDGALMLSHWKFYLRAIINAMLDVAIHAEGMTEQEAIDLMTKGGFQESDEARAKYLRARLTATQLSTYYLGSLEMWDLEVQARERAAVAAGSSAGAVPGQRVVGDLGETPGFDYRAHLESVISHGTPPIKWVKRILAEQAPAS